MEAFKSVAKNILPFLLVGIVPSVCWASGLFSTFSWASFFLLTGGFFCILWIRTYNNFQALRKLLLSRGEAWALCEGEHIVDRSPSFPGDSLEAFKAFLHPASLPRVQSAILELIHNNHPFHMRVHASAYDAIYSLEGISFDGKFIFWLKNITETARQERLHMELFHKNEVLLADLNATMDLLPIPIWHRDEHHKINYCNQAYSHAVQATPSKVHEKGIEFINSRIAKTLSRKAVNTGELQSIESAAIVNGERRYFRIFEIPNVRSQGTLGVAFDITERNEARVEIKRLMEAHDKVLAHLSTAIAVYDADGTLQYYNQAFVNLYNFDREFLKTHPRLDEVLEDLRSRRQLSEYTDFPAYKKRRLQELKEQTEPQEDLTYLPDERTLRIFSAPHPMGGLLFMCEDVTNYLALERKNKTLLEAYQTTLDNLFEGAVVIGSDNRLKIFNSSFMQLWNLKEENVESDMHLTSLVERLKDCFDYEGDWEDYKAWFIENITDRVPKTGQLKQRDGTTIKFGYMPLPNGEHLLSFTEVRNAARAAQTLQTEGESLPATDRLKLEFIANASYGLKAPLDTIIKFTEILSQQHLENLNEKQINYINGVLESSNKLLHLVNDILDLTSLETGCLILQFQEVNIPNLLKEVTELIAQKTRDNQQTLNLECNKGVNNWIVDEKRLKQAVFNLLVSAIQYTPPNGNITIQAQIIKNALEISIINTEIENSYENKDLLLSESIPTDQISQIKARPGLSLVKTLIELHGGRVLIFSGPEEGTKISCFIPFKSQKKSNKDRATSEASISK